MTNSPADRDVLEQLHALFAEDELSGDDLVTTDEAVLDTDLSEALSAVGLDAMSPDARELLLGLTDYSENLEPAARESLVSAAERAMQWRRDNSNALPVLLFTRRRQQELSPQQVADALDIEPDAVAAIESGSSSLRSATAPVVARWINLLRVSEGEAEAALMLGVARPQPTVRAAGRTQPSRTSEIDKAFVDQVLQHLRDLAGR